MAAGTFYGLAHHGHWLHVGTPEAILEAERTLNRI
jgi:NDP-sugar pyrophosphorylase family protein